MDLFLILVRLAQYAALLPLFGLAVFPLYAGAAASPSPKVLRTLVHAGLIAGPLYLFAQAISMAGGVEEGLKLDMLWTVLSATPAGLALIIRILALKACAFVAARRNPWLLIAFSGLALASLAFGGHGNGGQGLLKAARLAVDMIHLGAAGVWIGALFALLALTAWPGRAGPAATTLQRFSGIGSTVVGLIVVSGLFNAWALVGWPAPPWRGGWAWLMTVKLALVAGMLLLAALNRWWLTPALAQDGGPAALRRIRLSLWAETTLAGGVAVAVSVLGTFAPPR